MADFFNRIGRLLPVEKGSKGLISACRDRLNPQPKADIDSRRIRGTRRRTRSIVWPVSADGVPKSPSRFWMLYAGRPRRMAMLIKILTLANVRSFGAYTNIDQRHACF